MAASSPGRSEQVTWTATGRRVFDSSSHETSTRRTGSRSSAFEQSRVGITTPCPRLMKPMIGSPGTGVQHLANLSRMSASPWTLTPAIERFGTGRRAAAGVSGAGPAGAVGALVPRPGRPPTPRMSRAPLAVTDRDQQIVGAAEPQPLRRRVEQPVALHRRERGVLLAQLATQQIAPHLPAALALLHPNEVRGLGSRAAGDDEL